MFKHADPVISASTTATSLISSVAETDNTYGRSFTAYNDGPATVYIGGAGVTSTTGIPVAAGDFYAADIAGSDDPQVVTGSGTAAVRVVHSGV